jgi:hypothetical protein
LDFQLPSTSQLGLPDFETQSRQQRYIKMEIMIALINFIICTMCLSLEVKLLPQDGTKNTFFGSALSMNNSTLVVGAERQQISGALYIYKETNQLWSLQTKLVADDRQGNVYFQIYLGSAVSLYESSLAAGAVYDDSSDLSSGIINTILVTSFELHSWFVYLFVYVFQDLCISFNRLSMEAGLSMPSSTLPMDYTTMSLEDL